MSNESVPLSYSADELLGVLERQVRGDGPASAWLRVLVAHDSSLVASVAPGGDVNAAVGTGSAEAGPTVTRALVAERASRRASTLGAAVARATDVAAALVEMTGEATTGEPPVAPPPTNEQTPPRPAAEPEKLEDSAQQPPQKQVLAEPLERPTPTPAPARGEEAPSTARGSAGRARTFRVFVSSTFEDFGVERDVLRREVWPPLRELCARSGARFQPIDLRWGVSEEAAVDQQAMNICLGEIQRCQEVTPRPDFLVLLGNRYGWLPPPPQIPEGEFTRITDWLGDNPGSVLPWGGEAVPKPDDLPPDVLLKQWYERDDNSLGPIDAPGAERRLRRRTGAHLDRDVWQGVERHLVKSLAAAVEGLGLPEEARRRYLFSATAQEIAAGALDAKSPEQAVCFIREIDDLPEGVGAKPYVDLDGDQRDENAAVALETLKEAVTNHLGERRVVTAERPVSWGSHGPEFTDDYLRDFAVRVRDVLARSIEEELEHPTVETGEGALQAVDALDQEVAAHQGFARERRLFFTGREDELARIQGYLDGRTSQPLVVYGEGGTGKSAVIAQALLQAEKRDGATVVGRFIGATPGSSDGRSLLTSMCQELARVTTDSGAPVPTDYADLVRDFHHRLEEAAAGRPLWVFVDSLDQLAGSDGGSSRSLTWVPPTLPPGVRMVLSTRAGATLEPLRRRSEQLELGGLPAVDGAELLTKWLDRARRTLQDSQRQAVLSAFERSEGNPLYLRLAFEEARRWVSGDGEPPEELALGLRGLIEGNLLARLASEDNHGQAVVGKALGYLAASRHGLAEDELTDLLSRDPELYRRFLIDAYHLPGDLVDSASAYSGRPAGREPATWLAYIREAARILEEPPWQLHHVLDPDRGHTIEELAERVGVHAQRVQMTLSRMSSDRLAAADDEGRWTATATASAAEDPQLAWATAYRTANGGDRWRFPELDPAQTSGLDEGAAAQAWLERLGDWRDELDTFIDAVVPARVPAAGPEGQSDPGVQLVARPRPGPDLPVVFWSRLSFDLAPYLTERRTDEGDLLGFYHRELQEVAADVYAKQENGRTLHGRLANYFQAEADPLGDRSWVTEEQRGGVRGLSELPYHLTHARRWDEVYETLTDFRFLEQKAIHVGVTTRTEAGRESKLYTGVFQLQDDYDRALRSMPGGEGDGAGGARLVVTAVDLGSGLAVRCPHCNTEHPFERECSTCKMTHRLADWTGQDLSCPNKKCGEPLRVNAFVVGPSPS